jgi:hypothetical protein
MEISSFTSDFENLPKYIQKQALDYIEYLIEKYKQKKDTPQKEKFNFEWEGGLAEQKENFTSVELQHYANKLR